MDSRDLITGNKTVHLMGTTIKLTIIHRNPQQILDKVVSLLEKYEGRFSANDSRSELSEVNHKAGIEPVQVHPEIYDLIEIGRKHSLAKNSLLNIAIGPLIQTWRIGFNDARVPSSDEIEGLLPQIDPNHIQINPEKQTVFLTQKEMAIDLGALAKGYIADRIIDYLQEVGVHSALINLGGNLVTFGPALNRADHQWRVGIQNPVKTRGNIQFILKVQNKSVVTSGIYERKLEQNGQTFHHIFDSKTGYPIETNTASLTIVSDLSIDGEIWTTRLYGQPIEQIIKTLNETKGIDGLAISTEGKVAYSEGMKDLLDQT